MAMEQMTKSNITLKGSAEIVCDYLNYGINSILYQRGIYPPESFRSVENYDLPILMCQDNNIKEFMSTVLNQFKEWIIQCIANKVALIITNVKTMEVMERWDFNVEYEGSDKGSERTSDKPLKQIKNEIRDVMKQITSSVTYLPLLDCPCSFDIQIYADYKVDLPSDWADVEPANIYNAQSVKMKSFSTKFHKMGTVVTFQKED